jgi:light-regulated signal transduction histidine kinase (bacteriophytochrome)
VALHEIVLDGQGNPVDYIYLQVNPAFEKHTGVRVADILGKRVTQALPGIEKTGLIQTFGKVALTGEPAEFELFFEPLQRHYHISAYHVGECRFAVVFEDITKRKRIEMELQEQTLQLENSNRELESFSYSVAHDLRAPLRAIDGYSRMILRKHADKLDEDALVKFNVIRHNTQMMGQLIEDLLAFSRLGKKPLSVAAVDVEAIVKEAWEELKAANPERSMTLRIEGLPPGMGDRALIREVVANILSNAVKFAGSRDKVVIEAGGYEQGTENVYTIKDNGVGFDMAYYDKLFGMFQRLHNPDEYEGTGVGLAIAQRIINRHGGRIWASGEVDKGATFSFSLPVC